MSTELENIWSRVQRHLGATVDEATYRVWLAPLRPLEFADDRLTIAAPQRTCGWIADRFGRVLQACVAAELGPQVTIDLIDLPDAQAHTHAEAEAEARAQQQRGDTTRGRRHAGAHANPRSSRHTLGATGPTSTAAATPRSKGPRSSTSDAPGRLPSAASETAPNPKLSFEQFVIGDSNRLAHAAALAVAEMPSQAYNPLFLCGPPGLGKTHLLHSIANFVAIHGGGLSVRYTTGESFTNEFLAALRDGDLDDFKDRFRRVDVLLVDDVQFLENKTRTEEEFFHTFNALADIGSQLVLTSDRPPRDLEALEDRLRERFESGLVADVRPPDRVTRLTILRKRVAHDGIAVADPAALDVIAERIALNVRALEGALIRIVAYASLTGRPLNPELATEVIDGLYGAARPTQRSIAEIQAAACEHFGLSAQELVSRSRASRVAVPRQVAMYVARELTDESLPTIARQFGGRDHTTVLHAWRRTSQRIASEEATRLSVQALIDRLRDPN